MRSIRPRVGHSTVVAYLALFVALGGRSYAAVKINGKDIKDGSIAGKKLQKAAITTVQVKDASLLAKDFKPGELPAGAPGATGPQGPPGVAGANGKDGAPGASGATNVVVRTAAVHLTGTSSVAACATGERATGGGGFIASPGDKLTGSAPYVFDGANYAPATAGQTPNAWFIDTGASASPPVYVICASP